MKHVPLIVAAFRDPFVVSGWDTTQWDLVLCQLRQSNMIASMHASLNLHGLLIAVPEQARRHLEWAALLSEQHLRSVRYEVNAIRLALEHIKVPLVLLKGAAYVMADLPRFAGRIFSDIDILIPKDAILDIESSLMIAGWHSTLNDPYDQHYYRVWMHELPPMTHVTRGTVIDVHHAIVPITSRMHPDSAKLLANAQPIPGEQLVCTLSGVDMVLHSAAHLFCNGEFENGFRDLLDLHNLLCHYAGLSGFWDEIVERAVELQLSRPMFYALRYVTLIFETPVPFEVMKKADAGRPNAPLLKVMDSLFERALLPHHQSCKDCFTAPAIFALYLRGNWLRMPPFLLARHLFQKAFISKRNATPERI
ncbi:nucleotidyltransferase domain-containing protein [Undibacterium sp. SXout20W]|uniref:nucleotidyltransferase domain-containing protein n=1 Tax=Undibacterium sp. SXout20W TaxID=3413051 RepID=UPI003BEFA623